MNNSFEFTKYTYEAPILKLHYLIDEIEFIEEINFNPNNLVLRTLNENEKTALDLAFKYLHLMAGISYYKALLPKNIKVDTIDLNEEQAKFFDILYYNGLGEFAFKNQVKLNIQFPVYKSSSLICGKKLGNKEKNIIIPIGGGKDSIVTLEMLKKLPNVKLYTFSVNTAKPIDETAKLAGVENILVKRTIAPQLLKLNKLSTTYNGHVPITAIIAFISVATGILYGCNTVVFSNEKSANIGNKEYDGTIVNHQWSKSFEAEKMIHDFIKKYIISDFDYFSLLRPIYEIHIAKLFSKIEKYDNVFSSCNKNFKIIKNSEPARWCNNCDKCRFVFLILAAFIEKNRMINIFGENILNDEKQLVGYEELTGLSGYKPFECVGEVEESQLAFYLLQKTEFKNDFITKKIFDKLSSTISEKKFEEMEKKYMDLYFEDSLVSQNYQITYETDLTES